MTTIAAEDSQKQLEQALASLLDASSSGMPPRCLYQLYYEQLQPISRPLSHGRIFEFPPPSLSLVFDDESLSAVKEAWRLVMGPEVDDSDYMAFEDREGAEDIDDYD